MFHGGQHLLSIDPHGPRAGAAGPSHGYVHDSTFAFGFRAYHLEQSSRIIIERNTLTGAGLTAMGNDVVTFYGTATEMLWFAHNEQRRHVSVGKRMDLRSGIRRETMARGASRTHQACGRWIPSSPG